MVSYLQNLRSSEEALREQVFYLFLFFIPLYLFIAKILLKFFLIIISSLQSVVGKSKEKGGCIYCYFCQKRAGDSRVEGKLVHVHQMMDCLYNRLILNYLVYNLFFFCGYLNKIEQDIWTCYLTIWCNHARKLYGAKDNDFTKKLNFEFVDAIQVANCMLYFTLRKCLIFMVCNEACGLHFRVNKSLLLVR